MTHEELAQLGISWPAPPSPDAIEWPGTPIGAGNVVTRTKSRTAFHDKTLDEDPAARDALIERAAAYAARCGQRPDGRPSGRARAYDVVIHGVRVRATTNMPHLLDFWVDNWFGVEEWRQATGREPPAEPAVTVFALGDVPEEEEAAYYSRQRNTIVFFSTSYYGQLKSWVLGAVGRILADEYGIHSIHGAAVNAGGRGVLFIAPTGTGKSTASYGLMRLPGSAFHSDDWVYVRYALTLRDGSPLCPTDLILPDGRLVRGFRVFDHLRPEAGGGISVEGLTLDNDRLTVPIEALDLARPPEAYAYISEKRFYLRSNLVESFASAAPALLRSKHENSPDVSPHFLERHRPLLDHAVDQLDGHHPDERKRLAELLGRLIAFDNARAMLDIRHVFDEERVYASPLTPLRIDSVFLLRRDAGDDTVLQRLSEGQFTAKLVVGRTPAGTMETAYNAYRAVDDGAERAFIDRAVEDVGQTAGPEEALLDRLFAGGAPDSLVEEFTLFRQMYRAAACFEINTVLKADPAVGSTREAVELTLRLLERAVSEAPEHVDLHLNDYRRWLA